MGGRLKTLNSPFLGTPVTAIAICQNYAMKCCLQDRAQTNWCSVNTLYTANYYGHIIGLRYAQSSADMFDKTLFCCPHHFYDPVYCSAIICHSIQNVSMLITGNLTYDRTSPIPCQWLTYVMVFQMESVQNILSSFCWKSLISNCIRCTKLNLWGDQHSRFSRIRVPNRKYLESWTINKWVTTDIILYNTIQYSFIVWLADRNHIKAQNKKVNIWKKMSKAERYI